MKKLFILSILPIFFLFSNAQITGELYDSVLAKKLHADEYGMKNYVTRFAQARK